MITKVVLLFLLFISGLLVNASDSSLLYIANFSSSDISGWNEKIFKNKTSYQLIQLENRKVLKADSHNSASGLVKNIHVDLKKHPYLNWSWRIENRLSTGNEKTKSGDDYAARIYIVIDGGLLFWKTKALSYVWANRAETGETWNNAFAGKNAVMMALKSRQSKTSTWYFEKRNVYKDLKKLFGTEFQYIDAVALMTDTDNSNGKVRSYYGDIYFSSN